MTMKKSLALAAVLGVATLLATPVVGNAASFVTDSTTGTTTATVGLTQNNTSPIVITSAPDINFGDSNVIGAQALDLSDGTAESADPITVENPGLASGWNVAVSGTKFTDGSDSSSTLEGAVFTIGKGEVVADDKTNLTTAPISKSVIVGESGQTILSAGENSALGIWHNTHSDQDIQLHIPVGAKPGSYTSTLTWTLTNTPA